MGRAFAKIIDGPFADLEGEIVSVDGDKVLLRVTIFGRETPVELRRDQLERPEDIAALQPSAEPAEISSRGCGAGSLNSTTTWRVWRVLISSSNMLSSPKRI